MHFVLALLFPRHSTSSLSEAVTLPPSLSLSPRPSTNWGQEEMRKKNKANLGSPRTSHPFSVSVYSARIFLLFSLFHRCLRPLRGGGDRTNAGAVPVRAGGVLQEPVPHAANQVLTQNGFPRRFFLQCYFAISS